MLGIPSVITLGQFTADTVSLQIIGPAGGGKSSVAQASDVNGDGSVDLLVGASRPQAGDGSTYFVYGGPGGPAAVDLGSGLIDPEEDGGGEEDGGHEGVGASVVAHGDAAPVLEAAEHVLGAMPLPVKDLVVGERDLAAAA